MGSYETLAIRVGDLLDRLLRFIAIVRYSSLRALIGKCWKNARVHWPVGNIGDFFYKNLYFSYVLISLSVAM